MTEKKINDPIAKTLDLVPLEKDSYDVLETDKVDDDYEFARTNIIDIISKGTGALEDMAEVAKQSESPRAYEVLTTQIKVLVDANKDLLELAKKKRELQPKQEPQKNVTNNNLFVGSPTELLDMISQNKNASNN